MSRTDPPPYTDQSTKDVSGKNFTVRLRGLDPDEVRSFMAGLAHDLEGLRAQVSTLTQENETLNTLIDEAMQAARDLLLTARSRQRDIMDQAKVAATGLSAEPWPSNAPAARTLRCATSSTSGCSPRWRRCSSRRCSMHSTTRPRSPNAGRPWGGVSR